MVDFQVTEEGGVPAILYHGRLSLGMPKKWSAVDP